MTIYDDSLSKIYLYYMIMYLKVHIPSTFHHNAIPMNFDTHLSVFFGAKNDWKILDYGIDH